MKKTLKDLTDEFYLFNGLFKEQTPSPANEPRFLSLYRRMLEYLREDNDPRSLSFDGEGAYGGKQFSFTLDPYEPFGAVQLEVVLQDNDTLVVYTGRHNGFWVAPFISIQDKDLYCLTQKTFRKVMGLDYAN
jgi:hypothetical protein